MPENRYADFTLEGGGLGRFEKRKVEARLGGPTPVAFPRERTAYGRTTVSNGAFRIAFPDGREVGIYKPFVLFVDVNGDGSCTPGHDQGFQGATGGTDNVYVFSVDESLFFPMDSAGCQFMTAPWME